MSTKSKHIELAGTATLGPKGQVVIPADVREKMSIEPGDKLIVVYLPDKQSVGFIKEDAMQSLIDRMGDHLHVLKRSAGK